MRPAGFHPYALNVLAGYFIFFNLIVFEVSHLDQAVAFYYDEDLVLAVVPVLAFGNAWLTDVDLFTVTGTIFAIFYCVTGALFIYLDY